MLIIHLLLVYRWKLQLQAAPKTPLLPITQPASSLAVLDSDILKPKLKTQVDSQGPLMEILGFEWDKWGDAIMQNT